MNNLVPKKNCPRVQDKLNKPQTIYTHYKKKRKLLKDLFLGVKIIDFQNDIISVALTFNKDLYNRVSSKI